jgi:hypothetical protein
MKIFLITHNEFGYDSYSGHVVVANSEEEVRILAKKDSADEGELVWDTANVSIVGEYSGDKTDPFILLSDFHAG